MNWILKPMKDVKVSLANEVKLEKFSLTKPMHDTEIQTELQNPNPMDVEIFLPLLWQMLSLQPNAEEGSLLTNGYSNIFHVKLKDSRVVAVVVRWIGDVWRLSASELDCADGRWSGGRAFFTLATA